MTVGTTTERIAVRRTRRRRPWIRAALGCVLVAVAVTVALSWHSRDEPLRSLSPYPTWGMGGPVTVGQTSYLGANLVAEDAIDHPDRRARLTVRVSRVTALVRANTARADITVERCVLASDGRGPLGDDSGASRCSRLSRFTSGLVTLGYERGDDDVVLAITPRRPGVVRLSGLEVQYESGSRHGRQHVGVEVRMRAR